MATLTRGKHGRESVLVKGSIESWLMKNEAKPTKDSNRFVIKGWRCVVTPVSHETISVMNKIFDKDY